MLSASEFIQAVKDRLHAPESQMSVDDPEILQFLNEELNNTVWPYLTSLRKNWYVVKTVIALGDNYPGNRIPVPHRAFASGVREIKYTDVTGGDPYNMPEIGIDEQDQWNSASQSNRPAGYCIESDHIQIVGTKKQLAGDLHIWYTAAPSEVVLSPGFSVSIKQLDSNTPPLATFDIDADFVSYIGAYPTSIYDIARRSTGAIVYINNLATKNIGSTALTFSELTSEDGKIISNYQQGGLFTARPAYIDPDMYISRAGHTMYTPVPATADTWLISLVGARVLESIGDLEGMAVLMQKSDASKKQIEKVLGVRNQGESKSFNSSRGIFGHLGFNSRYRR